MKVELEDDAEVIEPNATKTDEGGSEKPDEAKADKGDEKPAVRETLDFVRERRQEMRGTEKPAPAKQTAKPAASEKDDEGGKEKPAAKADDKDEATREYTAEELVGKDLRNVDLKRVPEVLRETVKKMQGSHDRAVKDEQRAKAAYEAKIAELQSAKPQKDDDEDEDQFPILTELKEALATPKGRALIKDVLEKEGLSFTDARESSQQKIIATAVSSATAKYADLKDEKFFDEVITVIEEDDDLTATFRENLGNARGLSSVFKAAAAQVKASRGTAEKTKIEADKERIKREKEKENAKPGSQAARATTKSGEAKPSTTLDFIKNRRAQLRGT